MVELFPCLFVCLFVCGGPLVPLSLGYAGMPGFSMGGYASLLHCSCIAYSTVPVPTSPGTGQQPSSKYRGMCMQLMQHLYIARVSFGMLPC
jgi:hypothetical protein